MSGSRSRARTVPWSSVVCAVFALAWPPAESQARQPVPTRLEVVTIPPVPGIVVEAVGLSVSAITEPDGRAVLVVPPGVIEVRGTTPLGEVVSAVVEVEQWSHSVTLDFPGLRTVTGSAVVRTVPGATVEMSGRTPVRTLADGLARFDGLHPGNYLVRTQAPGAREWTTQRITVAAGQTATVATFGVATPRSSGASSAAEPVVEAEPPPDINREPYPGTGLLIVEARRPTAVGLGGLRFGVAQPGRPLIVRLPTGREQIVLSTNDGAEEIRSVLLDEHEPALVIAELDDHAEAASGGRAALALLGVIAASATLGGTLLRRRLRSRISTRKVHDSSGYAAGERLGEYEIIDLVGRGGMGIVYRARASSGQQVALKVMDAALENSPDLLRKFFREARVLGAMNARYPHAPIVRVSGYGRIGGDDTGRPYIAMEFLNGCTLEEIMQRHGALPVAAAVGVARQVTEALVASHHCGVLHRDVSPENIILLGCEISRPDVRVIDFGVAKHEHTRAHTVDGSVFGKPAYIAPEQWRGEATDGRTDLYSLGVVFYLMLSGATPFSADNPISLMRMHEMAAVPALPATVDARVGEVVMKLLAKSPVDRYASADDLFDDLRLLESEQLTTPFC